MEWKGSRREDLHGMLMKYKCHDRMDMVPLIHAGIEPPVSNPMQSLVNELQLKSGTCKLEWYRELHMGTYLIDGTAHIIGRQRFAWKTRASTYFIGRVMFSHLIEKFVKGSLIYCSLSHVDNL